MIQIAILGLGTVGTGVAKVVSENGAQIARKLGEPLELKRVLVRHFKDGPYRHLMTDDFAEIEQYNLSVAFGYLIHIAISFHILDLPHTQGSYS